MCIRDRYMGKEQRSTQFHARIFQEEGEKMLSSFRDRALHLKLHGIINPEMTEKVNFALRKKWFYNIQLIAVSINSPKGSIVQAKNIANALRNYSRDTNAPLYTFAEDVVFGAGNSILACGNKVFANEYSLVGSWGFSWAGFGFQDFIKHWKIEQEFIHAGENKVRLNPFKEIRKEDVEWLRKLLNEREYELKSEIIKYRSHKFAENKVPNESLETELFNKTTVPSEDLLKFGYIDGVSTLDKVLMEKYPGLKIMEGMRGNILDGKGGASAQHVSILNTVNLKAPDVL
eukprot:TRINITY_DN4419_c0_g3_i2.p1 TRINITY_DN4419_c0_g3~~TRINITY_DN4419_c0_g3_i2.p1  ORF type:complete len:288 (-),score=98.29 TRINITY_DN4419_c0_g3_i2:334-1197(-)